MRWIEKRPKNADANIKQIGELFEVRVRLRLPDGKAFSRELSARPKTVARKIRDDVYAAYNELALDILAGKAAEPVPPAAAPDAMTLRELAETCRDMWVARRRAVAGGLRAVLPEAARLRVYRPRRG